MRQRGSILIGLLWCVALLSIVVIGILHTARLDLFVVKNYGDRIQAHYLALAGIEKAKALLYQNARDRTRSNKNHTGELYNDPDPFRDVQLGRGQFRVFRRGRQDEGGGILYGISDEESRLNVNSASPDQLTNLFGMTPQIAAAIVDWRDSDNSVTPGGAEADYYASLQPPRLPRNGPFETLRELLMVRGVTPELLLGTDRHQNGHLGKAGDSEDTDAGRAFQARDIDAGWAAVLTVHSSINNVSASGQERVNIRTADEGALTGIQGITPEIARAIIAYRGQNRFQTIADLLDVRAPQNQNSTNRVESVRPGQSSNTSSGPLVINEDLFMDIADEVTVDSGPERPGVIDINTAGIDVLSCLPGIDRQLAQAILSYRQSSGFFPNVGWLLKVPGLTRDIFKGVVSLVSARSETYRILSEGTIGSTHVRQRIQTIVHVGLNDVTTLSWREDDL